MCAVGGCGGVGREREREGGKEGIVRGGVSVRNIACVVGWKVREVFWVVH